MVAFADWQACRAFESDEAMPEVTTALSTLENISPFKACRSALNRGFHHFAFGFPCRGFERERHYLISRARLRQNAMKWPTGFFGASGRAATMLCQSA